MRRQTTKVNFILFRECAGGYGAERRPLAVTRQPRGETLGEEPFESSQRAGEGLALHHRQGLVGEGRGLGVGELFEVPQGTFSDQYGLNEISRIDHNDLRVGAGRGDC